ncbi:hypothetical protein [Pelagicoccus mobilis]|uniref:Uncharacterized protein n=1 Tax=Pelagicoccus mobilis TaxID=415221 RepID=A0A934RZE9_9BACT|nr:hypothetical protein [Pelagicoccus mobilis]MBK1876303.1 hypothetical protein [Pelagicoccus mobilis]
MSLINQALKLEQQKRQGANTPQAPMVAQFAHRRQNSNLAVLLIGFTGMGMLLAASVTAIFYFGNGFLEQGNQDLARSEAPAQTSLASAPAPSPSAPAEQEDPRESILTSLTQEELSTVQQMLAEREKRSASESTAPATAAPETQEQPPADTQAKLSTISQIQDIVDAYSIQGIRKAGKDTRVFLNGKIRRIGDVIDLEHDLRLVGFTETDLVFRTADGRNYKKAL